MNKVFLILHIVAVVIAIGPIAVATSMFPRALRQAQARPYEPRAVGALSVLSRICHVYAVVSVAVPLFGFALAGGMKGSFGHMWLMISIGLTVVAAVVLLFLLPLLRRAVESVEEADGTASAAGAATGAGTTAVAAGPQTGRIAMLAGLFNILWLAVAVLMVTRPH